VRRDSTIKLPARVGADTIIRRDSTGVPRNVPLPQPHDTVAEALAHAPLPIMLPGERSIRFNRAEVFASGALTLQDVLDRVVGVTTYNTGWISSPTVGAVAGNTRRVRVFIDGIEQDPLDARSNGEIDLSQIPTWIAEDIAIERTPGEVRVHIRSWRSDRYDDFTRTDIATGDQQTNMYRAFYGKRARNGFALQLGAQQYGTTPPSFLGTSADQLGAMARIGWAGKVLKFDGTFLHVGRNRGDIYAYNRPDTIYGLKSTRTSGILRLAVRDPDSSAVWGQIVASPTSYDFNSLATSSSDTVNRDTTASSMQVLGLVGTRRGPLSVAGGFRFRHRDSVSLVTPVVSGGWSVNALSVRANFEGRGADSLARMDAAGEVYPMPFIRFTAGVDRANDHYSGQNVTSTSARITGGLRLRETWIDLGAMRQDTALLAAPGIVDAAGDTSVASRSGIFATVEGRVWRSVYLNLWGVRWTDSVTVYQPMYQSRSEVFVRTNLPKRFPTGNFSFLASLRHEYRSAVLIPSGGMLQRAAGTHAVSGLLEIRLYSAVLYWQARNIGGSRNYELPEYLRNRTLNFYGVRWEFWN
jgi:hypothetical protein